MNKRIKRLWVKALRSGKYRQGRHMLRKKDHEGYRYCCLGVLEDLRCKETGGRFTVSPHGQLLAPITIKWAELDNNDDPEDPALDPDGDVCSAGAINDNGAGFRKIADLIEKNL